ncbi:MAG: hypothetical protein AB7O26_04380 [Planctomycetaceae bacterium]
MSVTLTLRDESTNGEVYHERPLELPSEKTTLRELIRARVYQEVQDFNRETEQKDFRGLVQPTDTERVLNGKRTDYRLRKHREIDWKEQFDKAIEAYERNGFFVLIDDKQADALDQEFVVTTKSSVSFVKLTPLVGG